MTTTYSPTHDTEDRDYWIARFSEGIVRSSFPSDHPPGVDVEPGEERLVQLLPRHLADQALRISNGSDVRLFIVLLSAVTWLLHRYSNNREITVGVPIWRQEAEGDYVNTVLALKNRVHGGLAMKDLLLAVAGSLREANEHMNYPLQDLAAELGLEPSAAGSPLFDCAVLLDNLHEPSYLRTARPPVTFEFSRIEQNIEVRIHYRPALYTAETIVRIGRHLEHFLTAALRDVQRPLAQAELLDPAEKKALLEDLNETAETLRTETTLHHLFLEQAERTPDRVALVTEQGLMTYDTLARHARRIAGLLLDRGIRPGDVIAVVSEPSADMIAGVLGILEAGGAYLPIDPEWPQDRIVHTLEACQVRILLVSLLVRADMDEQGPLDAREDQADRQCLVLENVTAAPLKSLPTLPEQAMPQDLAYVLFTSGSTGHPKGVMVEHRSALNTLQWYRRTCGIRPEASTMLAYEATSDPSIEDIFAPLMEGATLCLPEQYAMLERGAFRRFAERHRLQLLNCGPGLVKELLDPGPKLATLEVVLSGGDVLEESLKNRILAQGYVLYNDYGPTEAAIDCLSDRCGDHRVSVGRAISNMRCYVLGDDFAVQPPGATGQLFVAGIGLARGYFGKAGLTAERFLPDPFGDGERMYDTGDLGRWRCDGRLEFLGRSDDQVKIRGYRVETGEIVYQLLKIPQIEDAVVIPTQDAEPRELCAYVVTSEALEAPEIRAHLRDSMPDYMVPKYVLFLDRIPLTAIGKIDRRALPDPTPASPGSASITSASLATDDFESAVRDIWQNILGLEEIGPHQNFFELGGHSLNVVEVKSALGHRLGKEVPIVALFQHATLRSLGQYLKNQERFSQNPKQNLKQSPKQEPDPVAEDSRMDTLAETLEIFGAN